MPTPHSPSSTTNVTPRVTSSLPGDIKMECVCTYNRDMGKLLVTDNYIQFRSLHFDEKIDFSSIDSIKKKGGAKIKIVSGQKTLSFGPFDAVRRGTVFETLRACHSSSGDTNIPKDAGGIDINAIEGLDDQIITDIFDEPTANNTPPNDKFIPVDDKDTPCVDETFSISLRNLFALILSDSSQFLIDLHTKEGDIDLVMNPWSLDETGSYHTRLFDFRKKTRMVNCLVHQTQNVKLISPSEMLVETSNKMEGVPFADCFTVDTKWKITETDGECKFQSWVKVNFTRSVSLVKGKIERNSISGTSDYFKAFIALLASKFTGDKPKEIQELQQTKTESEKTNSSLPFILSIIFGTASILFFILWIWFYWSSSNWAIYAGELENNNLELQVLIEKFQSNDPIPPPDMKDTLLKWSTDLDNAMKLIENIKNEIHNNYQNIKEE